MEIKFAMVIQFHFGYPDGEEHASVVIDSDTDKDVLNGLEQAILGLAEWQHEKFDLDSLRKFDQLDQIDLDWRLDNHITDYHVIPILLHGDRQFVLRDFDAMEVLRHRD